MKPATTLDTSPPMLYNGIAVEALSPWCVMAKMPPSRCLLPGSVFRHRFKPQTVITRLATAIKAMNNSRFVMRITSRISAGVLPGHCPAPRLYHVFKGPSIALEFRAAIPSPGNAGAILGVILWL